MKLLEQNNKKSFICFEGIAGAGKSSQSEMLKKIIEDKHGKKCFISAAFEGDRKRLVEEFVVNLSTHNNPTMIMFLFQSLHSIQYEEVIRSLQNNHLVIADRWRESFFAYHNHYGPLAKEDILIRNLLDKITFKDLEPDLTFYIDLSPHLALERFYSREKNNKSCLDLPTIDFFTTMRSHYLTAQRNKNWIYIDGSQTIKKVHKEILEYF